MRVVAGGALAVFTIAVLTLNLGGNPRSWHDEGAALSLVKTLVQDGVYAVRSSDGYQTYGAPQSVGPPVVLPIAVMFKVFGVGLWQARIVSAAYGLIAVAALFWGCRRLWGSGVAMLAVMVLLGTPSARFVHFSRQVLGEIPALALLLCGWLAWQAGIRSGRRGPFIVAGLLMGAAIVTKSHYLVYICGALACTALLDLVYYRQKQTLNTLLTAAVACACVASWLAWQYVYFGAAEFQENMRKIAELASATSGFNPRVTIRIAQGLLGPGSGYFLYFWGFPALVYAGFFSAPRNREGLLNVFLPLFAIISLAYYALWANPWPQYLIAPASVTSAFVAKLWFDLIDGNRWSWRAVRDEMTAGVAPAPGRATCLLAARVSLALMIIYMGQTVVRRDVAGFDPVPAEAAMFLQHAVPPDAVIETWERELFVLTDRRYHFPDQQMLAKTNGALFRGAPRDFRLGQAYFDGVRPDYLVIGSFGRTSGVYDATYVEKHADLLATFGSNDGRFEIYKLRP